jgi:serine/threonine-protein kinase
MRKYTSHILFLLITLLVVVLNLNGFGVLDGIQSSIDDFLCSFTALESKSTDIIIVNIDGASQDEYGNWPWNHDLIGDLLAACGTGEPSAIAFDFEIKENGFQDSAGYTDILSDQISWVKNTVLPYDIALAQFRSGRTQNPKYLFDNALSVSDPLGELEEGSTMQVRKVFLPPQKVLESKPMLGFEYIMPDDDRVIRYHPMVMNYNGYYYPSLPLRAAAAFLNTSADLIVVNENENIQVGFNREIPIKNESHMHVSFPKDNRYRTLSAKSVLGEGFNLKQLKNKMILITADDFSDNQYFKTPVNKRASKVFVTAAIIDNIISGNLITATNRTGLWQLLILFILGCVCAFVLPQVNTMYRWMILFGSLFILTNVNYFLFSSFQILPNTVYIGLEIILFMLVSPLLDSDLIKGESDKKASKPVYIPKIVLSDEDKNKSETIDEDVPVRQLVDSHDDSANIKTAHIQLPEEDIAEESNDDEAEKESQVLQDDYQAIDLDENEADNDSEQDESESGSNRIVAYEADDNDQLDHFDNDIDLDDEEPEPEFESELSENTQDSQEISDTSGLKQLGRYQISGTLGKGAMGHVYKGVDPAINRPVALKTIRLDFVNDPEEMEELKVRLHCEAQAAGKLSHPNIVTIYDVGSEGHLQYIAMEYLEGQTLEEMIKKKVKFNFRILSKVIMQICSAMEYAHDHDIIHRDIKPANIMVLPDYTVKVMDFGIARIDSNSLTKTGIAMGTPNYISPEQLKGQNVDKRADIFSLGVVIYEMLLSKRPFKGENITSLIYSIINDEPDKPSNINPQIPLLFDHIIEKALKKDPADRYQSAKNLMNDISEFVESFV